MTKTQFFAIAIPVMILAAGCDNVGNAPPPLSPDDTKKALSEAKPEDQINWINRSPMPADEKARKIKEIEDKYGIKAGGVTGPSGVPGR